MEAISKHHLAWDQITRLILATPSSTTSRQGPQEAAKGEALPEAWETTAGAWQPMGDTGSDVPCPLGAFFSTDKKAH